MSSNNTEQPDVTMTIVNFVYSGLSLEQMNALPKWLIANLDKNKPLIKDLIEAEATRREQALLDHLASKQEWFSKYVNAKDHDYEDVMAVPLSAIAELKQSLNQQNRESE